MSEVEKLRALLHETREWLKTYRDPNDGFALYAATPLLARIDAALAESVSVHPSNLSDVVTLLENERDAARAVLSALCAEFEGAVAHADFRAAGSSGMGVPFHGDFASATQLPSVVGRMRWWAREMRKVIGEDKP